MQVLQQKAVLELAEENLKSYDRVIALNRERRAAGDISQVDLSRIELQRAQFESDLTSARVSLRTAKIQLLALLNERQSPDSFDVAGSFGFRPLTMGREEARAAALEARPDLRAALAGIEKAKADNRLAWANGSTDPHLVRGLYASRARQHRGGGFLDPFARLRSQPGRKGEDRH